MYDMYNCKNYVTDGGDTLHIGGKIEFDNGAFPAAENVPDTTGNASANAAVIKAILVSLKNAGLMVGDEWNIACKTATGAYLHDMPTAETLANSQAVTSATVEDGVITLTLSGKVEDLSDADHGEGWGVHKWIGFGITSGLASIVGIKFTQTDGLDPTVVTLSNADATEASDIGLSAGDFILYIKAEKVLQNPVMFTLGYDGYQTTGYKVVINEGE